MKSIVAFCLASLFFGPMPIRADDLRSDLTRASAVRAYRTALEARRLAATSPLSLQRLDSELRLAEEKLVMGRRDEAIGDLVYLVESPRFEPFAASDQGRAAVFLLGDSLGRAGAYEPARGYLGRILRGTPNDVWFARAAESLVDFGLESGAPAAFLGDLEQVSARAAEAVRGDIQYLRGRLAEQRKQPEQALTAYAAVSEGSRFWAQATYLAGLLEVERRNFRRGEQLFCKVADPKQTPKRAALFGGSDFFRVRDLARLGLGRVAHETYRFDDARYYYYLVPNDSEHLPEALYETATTRYEAKDYRGARDALEELQHLGVEHAYQDEAWILDAYVDLALCRFPDADRKLREFLTRYEPVRNSARRLLADATSVGKLVTAVNRGVDPAAAGLGVPEATARVLGTLLRVDAGYAQTSRRLAQLDHQLAGLRGAIGELEEARRKLSSSKEAVPQAEIQLGQRPRDKLLRIEAQLGELNRLLREAEAKGANRAAEVQLLRQQLEALELRARALAANGGVSSAEATARAADLGSVIEQDRRRASELHRAAEALRMVAEKEQLKFARDAFQRVDRRLTRLINRARLGRIETVLGRKRALEIEVEALSQGLLPRSIVDSLRAERYLQSDEEYWPFEGEDWADEYIGGEGMR
jgi:hypothetical protein